MIWIRTTTIETLDGVYHVLVGDELGNCFWLLFVQTHGFIEFKNLGEAAQENVRRFNIEALFRKHMSPYNIRRDFGTSQKLK